jgi:hypothetical protein
MLEGFPLASSLDELAEAFEFRVRKGAVEVQVEFHARHSEEVR